MKEITLNFPQLPTTSQTKTIRSNHKTPKMFFQQKKIPAFHPPHHFTQLGFPLCINALLCHFSDGRTQQITCLKGKKDDENERKTLENCDLVREPYWMSSGHQGCLMFTVLPKHWGIDRQSVRESYTQNGRNIQSDIRDVIRLLDGWPPSRFPWWHGHCMNSDQMMPEEQLPDDLMPKGVGTFHHMMADQTGPSRAHLNWPVLGLGYGVRAIPSNGKEELCCHSGAPSGSKRIPSGSPKTGWFLSSQRLLGSPLEPWQGGGPLNKRKGRNIQVKDLLLPRLLLTITSILLMVQKSCDHHLGCVKPVVNNEINYQPQLVQDFWTINSRWCVFVCSSKNYQQKPLKNGFFGILKGWEFMGVLCVFGVDSGAVVVSFQGG